jgi:hypothetical protein
VSGDRAGLFVLDLLHLGGGPGRRIFIYVPFFLKPKTSYFQSFSALVLGLSTEIKFLMSSQTSQVV